MALLPKQSAQAAPIGELDRSGFEKYVTDYMDRSGYPGVLIPVTHGHNVLMTAGYGHDSTGADMTADTPMPVASVSKSFTALAVMQLVESGAVALDESVPSYLPDLEVGDPRTSKITVRELLNQTSGISDETLREKSLPQPHSLQAAEQRAHVATPAEAPGTRHHFTNTNYHLAARLVEVVSQQPFADYLHERVLDPLGMDDSTSISVPKPAVKYGFLGSKGPTATDLISAAHRRLKLSKLNSLKKVLVTPTPSGEDLLQDNRYASRLLRLALRRLAPSATALVSQRAKPRLDRRGVMAFMLVWLYPSVSKCRAATAVIASRVRTARACSAEFWLPTSRPIRGWVLVAVFSGVCVLRFLLAHCPSCLGGVVSAATCGGGNGVDGRVRFNSCTFLVDAPVFREVFGPVVDGVGVP